MGIMMGIASRVGFFLTSPSYSTLTTSFSSLSLFLLCPAALWPLFHYLLWQDVGGATNGTASLSSSSASADTHWPPYEQANAAFTRAVLSVYQPGDLIWVHDYHLLLVPKLLRMSVPEVCVGLFVHTPWPSSEVFRCLPSELLSFLPFFPSTSYRFGPSASGSKRNLVEWSETD